MEMKRVERHYQGQIYVSDSATECWSEHRQTYFHLRTWRTTCPTCRKEFSFSADQIRQAGKRTPRRRCDDCKRPGWKVEREAAATKARKARAKARYAKERRALNKRPNADGSWPALWPHLKPK